MGTSISQLLPATDPGVYRATASIGENGGIDPSTSAVTGDTSSGLFAAGSNEMGKDDFLLLLVTQLKMQDPLSPMENTEFMTQLAQLRSLESSNNMEKAIADLSSSFAGSVQAQNFSAQAITNSAAVSMIGKEVRLKEAAVQYIAKAGVEVPINVHLGNAASAQVELLDENDTVVKTFTASGKDAENSVRLAWDGIGDDGQRVSSGSYRIRIAGEDTDSALYAFVQDTVAGVRFDAGGALLKVGGKELPIENVMDVSSESASSELQSLSPSSAIALLGKTVRMSQSTVGYSGTDGAKVGFEVNMGGLSNTTVRLVDAAGQTVRTIQVTSTTESAHVEWDGRTDDGSSFAKPGVYRIVIDQARTNPSVYAYSEGEVEGISSVNGATQIRMNGKLLPISDIVDIAPG